MVGLESIHGGVDLSYLGSSSVRDKEHKTVVLLSGLARMQLPCSAEMVRQGPPVQDNRLKWMRRRSCESGLCNHEEPRHAVEFMYGYLNGSRVVVGYSNTEGRLISKTELTIWPQVSGTEKQVSDRR